MLLYVQQDAARYDLWDNNIRYDRLGSFLFIFK